MLFFFFFLLDETLCCAVLTASLGNKVSTRTAGGQNTADLVCTIFAAIFCLLEIGGLITVTNYVDTMPRVTGPSVPGNKAYLSTVLVMVTSGQSQW